MLGTDFVTLNKKVVKILNRWKDVIDSDAQDYAEILKELNNGDDVDWEGETGLEGYTTKIDEEDQAENDEYLIFKSVFARLEQKAPQLYQAMTQSLTNEFTNVRFLHTQ